MTRIVGVRFRRPGPIYYFDAGDLDLKPEDAVVVSTDRGLVLVRVACHPQEVSAKETPQDLKPILRRAEAGDLERERQNRERAAEALLKARETAGRLGLPMKILDAEYNLEGSRLTSYFSAEGRVDFREMARELSSTFNTRVELHQVGARDATRYCGGLGPCGRPLCCASCLCSFQSISMKMAKVQDLPLNPAKISGLCGRLLCCLAYETEQYQRLKERLPHIGEALLTPQGPAVVLGVNPLKETVQVRLESEALIEVAASQTQPMSRK